MKFNFALGGLFGTEADIVDVRAARQAALDDLIAQQRQEHGRRIVQGKLPDSRHMTMARRPVPHREPLASYEALCAADRQLAEDGIEHLPDWPFGPEAMQRSQLIYQARRAKRTVRSPG